MHRNLALTFTSWRAVASDVFAAWVEAEHGRFMPWLPVFMAVGVACYFSLDAEPAWWPAAFVLACALVGARLSRNGATLPAACRLLAAAALGFGAAQFHAATAADLLDVPTRATVVTGTVRAVEALPLGRRITLEAVTFDAGPTLPRAVRLRLRAYGYALNPAELLSAAPPGRGAWLQRLRETINGRVAAVLPGSAGAVAATLLTGSTAAIPEADRAAFRDSGLAHLLAIAGLHIGIVMGTIFVTLRLLLVLNEQMALRAPTKQIAALAALAAGGAYLLLTGAHVPIQRSFAMACLVTLGVIVGRRALSLRGLAIAMAVVILLAPDVVMGVSFQMSFSAVLALIVGYGMLRPVLSGLHGDGSWRRRVAGHIAALALTDQRVGRRLLGPLRRLPFWPRAAVLRVRQHDRGAADGVLDPAAGHGRPGVDAAAPGVPGAGADELGRAGHPAGWPLRVRMAAGSDGGAAYPQLGVGGVQPRPGLGRAVAQPAAAGGLGGGAAGLGLADHGPPAGRAGVCRGAAHWAFCQRRALRPEDFRSLEVHPGFLAAVPGGGRRVAVACHRRRPSGLHAGRLHPAAKRHRPNGASGTGAATAQGL